MGMNKLELLIHSYIEKRKFKLLFSQMITYVNNCVIELSLKYKKLDKIEKQLKIIDTISKLPIILHKPVLLYIDIHWKKLVMENGFININKTLQHLNFDINLEKCENV